jgi:hypothetical protein
VGGPAGGPAPGVAPAQAPRRAHFSGHGTAADQIVFHNDSGRPKFVSKDAVVQAMGVLTDNIRLVLFNTCFSRNQAEAVTRHVEVAIGMNTTIGDEAARVFAAQFYYAIGFGRSVKDAFAAARAMLLLEGIREEETPDLFARPGVDPGEVILVRPAGVAAGG